MSLLRTWAWQKLPHAPLLFPNTCCTAGTKGTPAHTHLRHQHWVTHLEQAVAVYSLHECGLGLEQEKRSGSDCRRCLVLSRGVGQNKRYQQFYGKRMDERIEEFVMREELMMLTAAELDVENCRPTDFPEGSTPRSSLPTWPLR